MTFDQEDKGGASTLYRLLPTPQRMAKMVEVLILTKDKHKKGKCMVVVLLMVAVMVYVVMHVCDGCAEDN